MDVLLPVLLVALGVWAVRKLVPALSKMSARRTRAKSPGFSPDNPLIIRNARHLDEMRDALRCECGGHVIALGETSRVGQRVARGRCEECDSDVDLYFVLPNMLN